MQVSISAYYEWVAKTSTITLDPGTVKLEAKARALFFESKKSMGSRKLSRHLKQEGFSVGRFKARHLMKKLNLVVQKKKRFVNTTKSHHAFKIAANHLNRQFNPLRPNQVWTTDITYIPSKMGWVYLAVVIDLFSRQVVGWAVNDSMATQLCTHALQMAYGRRKPCKELIHHSDRGIQYASHEYQHLLKEYGMICSMSRKGNCWDNAPTERFFRSLKQERLHWVTFNNLRDAKEEIIDYITWYNFKRLHATLNYKTPLDFENQFYQNEA